MAEGTHAWLPMLCRLPALRPHDTPSLRSFVCLLVCGAGRALLICMGLFLPMPVGPPSISPPVCLVALIVFSPALWATRGPVIVLFDSERCKASQPAGHRQCCRARPGVEMHSVCTMDWMGCCSSPVSVCQLPGTRQAPACSLPGRTPPGGAAAASPVMRVPAVASGTLRWMQLVRKEEHTCWRRACCQPSRLPGHHGIASARTDC